MAWVQIINLESMFLMFIGFILCKFFFLNLDKLIIIILSDVTLLKIWHLDLLIFIRVVDQFVSSGRQINYAY